MTANCTALFVAMLGGAAGTYASFGKEGQQVQAAMGRQLGMTPMQVPSRVISFIRRNERPLAP